MTSAPFSLLAISDRRSLPRELSLASWVRDLGQARIPALQVREKDLTDRAVVEIGRWARRELSPFSRILINGRLDLALAAGVEGVHLPGSGLSVEVLRARFGPAPLIGCSTHDLEEVRAAAEGGADYVTFGPVFPTPSKAKYGPPLGLDALAAAAETGVPVLALGGIFPDRFPEVADAGAAGAAGIRMFQDPEGLDRLVDQARTFFGESPP
ncbi:MAG: thiamine phosphate synthase [Thermoanaerobaculia bacterium]|nr:thiamine phosphate synthase [Thermoanaerobaculia bacterium]